MRIPGYTLKHRISQGRYATLFLAEDSAGNSRVIKIIKTALSDQKLFRDEFKKHSQLLTRIIHPNCIRVYDAGVVNNLCYMVMDYFPDGSIAPRLIFGFPVKQIINIVLELTNALEYLNTSHIEHRNIHPRNIFLTKDNHIILSEYEVVRQIINDCPEINYAEEHSFRAEQINIQSDIDSLGLVFFKLLNRETTPYLEIPRKNLSGRRAVCWQGTMDKLFTGNPTESIRDIYQLRTEIYRVQAEFKQRINREKIVSDNSLPDTMSTDPVQPEQTANLPVLMIAQSKKSFDLEVLLLKNKVPILTGLAASTAFVIMLSIVTYFDRQNNFAQQNEQKQESPQILFPQIPAAIMVYSDKLTAADIRQKERLEILNNKELVTSFK